MCGEAHDFQPECISNASRNKISRIKVFGDSRDISAANPKPEHARRCLRAIGIVRLAATAAAPPSSVPRPRRPTSAAYLCATIPWSQQHNVVTNFDNNLRLLSFLHKGTTHSRSSHRASHCGRLLLHAPTPRLIAHLAVTRRCRPVRANPPVLPFPPNIRARPPRGPFPCACPTRSLASRAPHARRSAGRRLRP